MCRDKERVALGPVPRQRRGKGATSAAMQPADPARPGAPAHAGLPAPALPSLLPDFDPVEAMEDEPVLWYQFRLCGGPKKWIKEDPAPE